MKNTFTIADIERIDKNDSNIFRLNRGLTDKQFCEIKLSGYETNDVAEEALLMLADIKLDDYSSALYKKFQDIILYACACPKQKIQNHKFTAKNDESFVTIEILKNEPRSFISKNPFKELLITVNDNITDLILTRFFRQTREGVAVLSQFYGILPLFTPAFNCPSLAGQGGYVNFCNIDIDQVQCDILDNNGDILLNYIKSNRQIDKDFPLYRTIQSDPRVAPDKREFTYQPINISDSDMHKRNRIMPVSEYAPPREIKNWSGQMELVYDSVMYSPELNPEK